LNVQHLIDEEILLRSAVLASAPLSSAFQFEVPVSFFKAGDQPEGKQRRLAGIISAESTDQQKETILQRGLDLAPFNANGWFNDNHSKDMTAVLGYPEYTKQFARGQQLPDGTTAKQNLTWAEGYLLNTKKADDVWELGCALQGTNRRLGFSVEGAIEKRIGPNRNIIAKATVRHVALTHVPVNSDCRLEILARSLAAIENDANKAMGVGGGPALPNVPETGPTAGQVVTREDLEREMHYAGKKPGKRKVKKSLTEQQAVQWVKSQMPGINHDTATLFIRLTKGLLNAGMI
jgi:hypothetical protein